MKQTPTICIIGVGLIGGSLGLALRKGSGKKVRVVGLGRSAASLKAAVRRGAIRDFETRPSSLLKSADVVVLAVPVHLIPVLVRKFLPAFKKGALLTDVGSVKGPVIAAVQKIIRARRDLRFVGAHPIAGSEKTGVENADKNLFKGATCVVTTDRARAGDISAVSRLWRGVGATVVTMKAQKHDEVLSLTSHLPHLIAFSIFSQAQTAARQNSGLRKLTAGSFRDMTRIAASDAEMWGAILDSNRAALRRQTAIFLKILKTLSGLSRSALQKKIAAISQARRQW